VALENTSGIAHSVILAATHKPVHGAWRRRSLVAWLLVGVWAAAIFTLSSLPQERIIDANRGMSRASHSLADIATNPVLVHFVEFAVLAALIGTALRVSRVRWGGVAITLIAFGLAAGCGLLDEAHQAFVPGRQAGLDDALLDAIGAIAGALASGAVWRTCGSRRFLRK
jgi:VanZ family protein